MIKKELDPDDKMVVFSFRYKNCIFMLFLASILLLSCNDNNEKVKVLTNAVYLSNDFYVKNVESLRIYFDSKIEEEPDKYNVIFEKIYLIDNQIDFYSKLKTIQEKKKYLEELEIVFNSISDNKDIKFISINVNHNDVDLFSIIVENDFNRNLYKLYTEFYDYQLESW